MAIEEAKLGYLEVMELAAHVCGLPDDAEPDEIDEALYDNFEIEFERFQSIVAHLVPLCAMGSSPLTGKQYRGFANGEIWLARQEIPVLSATPESPSAGTSGFAIEDSCDADD